MITLERAVIRSTVMQRLVEDCRRRLPHETCGVLFGAASGTELAIRGYAVIRNASRTPVSSFSFDPADWTAAYYEALHHGRRIVGVFHSHPDGTTLPSQADEEGRSAWGTYWIIGVSSGESDAHMAGCRYVPDSGWVPLSLRVLEDEEAF
jgi:proteasome lid subunit RPN8/RPN11